MANDNLAFVGFFSDRENQRTLVRLATLRGLKPDAMAEELFLKGLTQEIEYTYATEGDECPPEFQLFTTYTSVRGREEHRRQLVTIALSVHETSDTTLADRLKDLCEMNGFLMDDVMTQAAHLLAIAPDTSIIFEQGDSASKAAIFLSDIFTRHNSNAVKQSEIEAEAKQKSISMNSLKVAKKALDMRSRRVGNAWWWEIATTSSPSSVRVKV